MGVEIDGCTVGPSLFATFDCVFGGDDSVYIAIAGTGGATVGAVDEMVSQFSSKGTSS